ncbi:hypothetical protein KY308_01150 [Candidatus Woesearchaeota archaeon]|nr:hypothetical protein [Candidatus Woesearchaeota archaeon]
MKLDQHFLRNEKIAKLMVSKCKIGKDDFVVEIGPGNGEVTKFIPECRLTLIEKDKELAEKLEEKFGASVITGDGVEELKKRSFDFLISSVPYSICEPLYWELMFHDFKKAVLTLPEKFVENISDEESSFAFIANNLLKIKIIKNLEKGDFEPEPKVNSVVAEVTKNAKASKILEKLVMQHDKKLKNALREALVEVKKITKKQAKEAVEKLGLSNELLGKSVRKTPIKALKSIIES